MKFLSHSKTSRQFITVIFLLAIIPITLMAVYLPLMLWPKAAISDPHLYIIPETTSMPPNTTFKLMMDAKTHQIGFVRAVLTFDRTKINLSSEITTTATLNQVDSNNNPFIIKTSRTDANNTGKIVLVLGLKPNTTAPTGNFELAQLPFTAVTTTSNTSTAIAFDAADIQLVNLTTTQLPFTSTASTLTLNATGPTATSAPITPTPTLSGPSPTPGATTTTTFTVASSGDDINEEGTSLSSTSTTNWLGTGGNSSSYLGLRFTNITVPKNATITSAYVELQSSQNQWQKTNYSLYAENIANSPIFSSTSKPSARIGTTAKINHSSDVQCWRVLGTV
jgi:hypothetical protein